MLLLALNVRAGYSLVFDGMMVEEGSEVIEADLNSGKGRSGLQWQQPTTRDDPFMLSMLPDVTYGAGD